MTVRAPLAAGGRALGAVLLLAAAATAGAGPPRPDYQVVNATTFGKVLVARRSDAPTVRAALRLTVQDLTAYFGGAPAVRGAYQDTRNQRMGGATFTVKAWGHPAKGLITCEVGPQGTKVAVVFMRADAPAGEWARLTQPAPTAALPAASAGDKPTSVASGRLRTYAFPDGTGTVGLAEGWHTDAPSALGGVRLLGPDGETITLAQGFGVQTPSSSLVGLPSALVAPYGSPLEVMRALGPQLSRASVRGGGPALAWDDMRHLEDRKPMAQGGRGAVLGWGVTETRRDGARQHFKTVNAVDLSPTSDVSFLVMFNQARAPDALFQRDLPVMLQMMASFKTDDARVIAKSNAAVAAQKQWFAGQQRAHQEQVRAFDEHNRSWERQQNVQARSNDDFDEVIRGHRTVEDSRTGERTSVDLGNVDRFVDDLNERDPGRYRQIPLRDEADPLPGR